MSLQVASRLVRVRHWMVGLLAVTALTPNAGWAILPSVVDIPPEFLVDNATVAVNTTESVSATEKLTKAEQKAQKKAAKDAEKAAVKAMKTAKVETTPSDNMADPMTVTTATPPAVTQTASQPASETTPHTGSVQTTATLADNEIQLQHKALYQELRDEDQQALADVGMLWQTAIERSGTIRFAIEKLSRKNAVGKDPNDKGFAQKMITQAARLGGVAGSMWTGTPAGLIGGNMVEEMMQSPGAASANQFAVTDADMVLLAKEVEGLQGDLIGAYYTYRHAQERLAAADQAETELGRYELLLPASVKAAMQHHTDGSAVNASTQSSALLVAPLVGSVVANVQEATRQAQQDMVSAREALILLVGADAVSALEKIHADEKAASKAASASAKKPASKG